MKMMQQAQRQHLQAEAPQEPALLLHPTGPEVYSNDVPFDPSQHGVDPALPPMLRRDPLFGQSEEEALLYRMRNFQNEENIRQGRLSNLGYPEDTAAKQEAARLATLTPEQRYYEQLARLGARRR